MEDGRQSVVYLIVGGEAGDIMQQGQAVWNDAVDLHEGQNGLGCHHSAHVVAVPAC